MFHSQKKHEAEGLDGLDDTGFGDDTSPVLQNSDTNVQIRSAYRVSVTLKRP